MNNPNLDIPVRAPAQTGLDDTILPFEVAALDLRGRIVRLGPAVDAILTNHDYPLPVAKLLGEAIVLTAMLGSALKFEGRFILQTQSDGPVRMLVVDFTSPGKVRACARFDADRVAARSRGRGRARRVARPRPSRHDHRPGPGHEPLPGPRAARRQRPRARRARIFPALRADSDPRAPCRRARSSAAARTAPAGAGAPAAFCCSSCPSRPSARASPISIPAMRRPASEPHASPEDDAWVEGRSLVATVDDIELIDPALSSERLPIGCSTNAACACSAPLPVRGAMLVLARTASKTCCAAFRRKTATTWSRMARSRDLRVLQLHVRVQPQEVQRPLPTPEFRPAAFGLSTALVGLCSRSAQKAAATAAVCVAHCR